jgi:hypothetical protein
MAPWSLVGVFLAVLIAGSAFLLRRAVLANYEARLAELRAARPAVAKNVREAIAPIVDPLLETGRATLDVQIGEWTTEFHLYPKNSGAARLGIDASRDQIDVLVGDAGSCKEIWQGCTPDGLEELVACVAAVAEGKYVEQVFDDDLGSCVVMTFGEGLCPRYERFGPRGAYGEPKPRTIRYEPY